MAKSSTTFKKGHGFSEETLRKIRLAKIGKPSPRKGAKLSLETREKIKAARSRQVMPKGENHHMWKGGITPLRKKLYFSKEYRLWRESVFKRDDYSCIWCGIRGGELNADHIKPWALYPELRFAIDNGRTLCISCHRKTYTWGRRSNNPTQ